MRRFAWLAPLICSLIVACTATQGGARLDGPGTAFPGIINGPAGAQPPADRFIFNIHGMGCTKRDYNAGLARSLESYGFARIAAPTPSISFSSNAVALREGRAFHPSSPDEDFDCDTLADTEAPPSTTDWYDIPLVRAVDVRGEGLDCDTIGDVPPCRYTTFGSLRVDTLQRIGAGGQPQRLLIYTYFLNDDYWAIQRHYIGADFRTSGRALINGSLKRDILDRGFVDAVAYVGPIRDITRESIRTAVCLMLTHAATGQPQLTLPNAGDCLSHAPQEIPNSVEFSFITHSLGSRMLFDALSVDHERAGLVSASRSAAESASMSALADHTRVVYMAANQLPLLGIGRVTYARAAPDDDCDALTFIYCRGPRAAGQPPLQVVGFFDPDDLLGYRADSGTAVEGEGVQFINIRHRNADQWLWTLTWPQAAHDQELNRETSRRLIFCGGVADANGRVDPNMAGCGRER